MTTALVPGAATAAPGRVDALHHLGTDVRHTQTAHEALISAGLAGKNIHKVAIQTASGRPVLGQYALEDVHGDPFNGITVGEGFQVVQYEESADLLDRVAARTGATFEAAGDLDTRAYGLRGARAFVAMQLPEAVRLGDDSIVFYIVAFMAHGASANMFMPTAVRPWCANQQPQISRGNKYKIVIRHTTSATARTKAAEETLVTTIKAMERARAEAEAMLAAKITEDQFGQLVEHLHPQGGESKSAQTRFERRVEIMHGIYNGPTNANIRGTAWGAYQALNEYGEWARDVRGGDGGIDDARARRALVSHSHGTDQLRAFTAVRELAGLVN